MDDKTIRRSDGSGDDDGTVTQTGTQVMVERGTLPRKILLGGVGVITAIIGVVLTLHMIQPALTGESPETEFSEQNGVNQTSLLSQLVGDRHQEPTPEGPVYTVDDIVVNPAGTGGTRFLSASFGFELESEEQLERFESREAIIRDALIMILSSKTIDQLTDQSQKESIREEIRTRVAGIISPPDRENGDLAGVYYTDFVLQ